MDIFKNLEEFQKKDFNKTAIVEISNYSHIFPYNFIDNNFVTDSSLNKYFRYYMKKQSSIIHDKRAFEMLEQLNNEKALEQLRTQREKEKANIFQNIFNKKDKKLEEYEYNNINLKNYIEKLEDKKNSEDQGYNIMYLLMKLLKFRRKKVIKKKKFEKTKSLLEEKRNKYKNKYNELLNNLQEKENNEKSEINIKDNKPNNISQTSFENEIKKNLTSININKINYNKFFDPKEIKNSTTSNILSLSEKRIDNNLNINYNLNKRKSFQIEKSNKLKQIKYSLLNSGKKNKNKSINNKQEIDDNKPKIKLNKLLIVKPNKNYSLSVPKSHKNYFNFQKDENEKNKHLLKEKINKLKQIKKLNSLNLDNKAMNKMNKTSFGKFDLQLNKKKNQKLLLALNVKEKEINNRAQELSNLIRTSYKKKEKQNYEKDNNKIINIEKIKSNFSFKENKSEKEEKENNKNKKDNKKIKEKNKKNNTIEYNIKNIMYENKSKYKLAVTNKYIYGNSNSETDIIDYLKNDLAYELKRQLIKKHSNDLIKINQSEVINKLNNKFRLKRINIYRSSSE